MPSPNSTAVVFTTTGSPVRDRAGQLREHVGTLGAVAEVDLDALQPGPLLEDVAKTFPVRNDGTGAIYAGTRQRLRRRPTTRAPYFLCTACFDTPSA